MKKSGNPGRPGNGIPGMNSLVKIIPQRRRWTDGWIDAGEPAGFQARVGKHLFDKIWRNFFAHPGFQFAHPAIGNACPVPTLPTAVHGYRHKV